MTAETLVAGECALVVEGFDVRMTSRAAVMTPLTLADAVLMEDGTFIWRSDTPWGPLAIHEVELPGGYRDYVVAGEGVEFDALGNWAFAVTPDSPGVFLMIYNFAPATATEEPVPTEAPAAEPNVAPLPTATPVVGRPVHVHTGTCDDLSREPRYNLTDLATPNGTPEGASEATVAETAFTVIDVPLDELLAGDWSITAHRDRKDAWVYVACGELGGPRDADGRIAAGLREQNGSGLTGIAYLVSDPEDPERTRVAART
jgi:hypothetical protein